MGVAGADRSSSTTAFPPSPALSRSRRSVHGALGGGAVADALPWRNRVVGASLAGAATAFWILFEVAGYNLLSLIANSLLFLVFMLFFWAKSASLLNRPLPPLPKLEISDESVARISNEAWIWINRSLSVARVISVERDWKLLLKVILVLWTVSFVGSLFSFLTFVYIGVLLSLIVPAFYEKFQDHIDEKLGIVYNLFARPYENVLGWATRLPNKKKKIQ